MRLKTSYRFLAYCLGLTLLLLPILLQPTLAAGNGREAAVVVATAEQRVMAPISWYAGTVISRRDARLPAEVEGRLVWVADVGSVVAAGDVLARMDDSFIRPALEEQRAEVAREQARLKFFEAEVKRLQRLAKQNVAAQSQLDQVVSDRAVARSELRAAQARVLQAERRLERSVLHAPHDGVVMERYLDADEWADSGAAIVRLVGKQELEVQTWVPVQSLAYLGVGSELRLRDAVHELVGKVVKQVSVGDDESRLHEVRIALQNSPWEPGQGVRVAIPLAAPREVIAVPRDALVLRRSGASLFKVLADNSAEQVPVTLGVAVEDHIEVRGAVVAGDRVVVRGGERLRPGQRVKLLNQQNAP